MNVLEITGVPPMTWSCMLQDELTENALSMWVQAAIKTSWSNFDS